MLASKHLITLLLFSCLTSWCFAQETVKRSHELNIGITEKFEVLKSDKHIKHGSYQAFRDTAVLANGYYRNGERSGHWAFYDNKHKMMQAYNYTRHQLIYQDTTDAKDLKYEFKDSVTAGDKLRYPVKIGGSEYGLALLSFNLNGLSQELYVTAPKYDVYKCLHIFTVGTEGELKKHEVLVHYGNEKKLYVLKDEELAGEYKRFIPGTINGQPAECKVYVNNEIRAFR